jgi:hypothetical protein
MDEWINIGPSGGPGILGFLKDLRREFFPPTNCRTYEFQNYVLGFKWTATDKEVATLRANGMLGHIALRLHDNYPPLTFADLLGTEYIPEVNPSQPELFRVEGQIREAAAKWTLFLANLAASE